MADDASDNVAGRSALSFRDRLSLDWVYILPMAVFLLLTTVGGQSHTFFVISYIAKTAIVGFLLIYLWRRFTPVTWTHTGLAILVGVIGIVQWVGMQLWLQNTFEMFKPDMETVFNPTTYFQSSAALWAFVAVRILGAVIVVPIMEELFWRDFLWRSLLAPADFTLARVGEWAWAPFIIVAVAFCTVHGMWWPTAIVWGLLIGGLLVYTKSIGACIIAHAVTNLLLAGWVLYSKQWNFW